MHSLHLQYAAAGGEVLAKKYTMHVLSHTHWDREWYQSFQGYRRRLVHQVDALLDLFDKRPEYKYFHFDSQTSWIPDYLEIRPEQKERLEKYIKAGRIIIGPWFTMPDEKLLSGESLVRNLAAGCRMCKELGVRPMPVGYVCDVFGHVSQFPQIISGFGIDTVFLHRGTGGDNGSSELLWEGADGTEVLVIKAYPHTGYQDFLEYRDSSPETLLEYEEKKTALATTGVLYALDGNDHQAARWDTPEAIKRVNSIFTKTRAVHSSMPRYVKELKKALGRNWKKRLPRFTGELDVPMRGGVYCEVFFGTGSARVDLKEANDRIEWLLSRMAEPFAAWSLLLGGSSQRAYLDLAWRNMFLNHAHDSICGCSIDQVHRDMTHRFEEAEMLGQDTVELAVQEIARRIDTSHLAAADMVVTVFNAACEPAGPVCEFPFEVPAEVAAEMAAKALVPTLLDEAGEPVPAEISLDEHGARPWPFMFETRGLTPAMRPRGLMDRYRVEAATHVPALGYRSFTLAWRKKAQLPPPSTEARVRVAASGRSIENALVRLKVNDNGTLDLYDKLTRVGYRGLCFLEDCGDAGHGWDHIYPDADIRLLSTDNKVRTKVKVKVARQGRYSAALEVSFSIKVPEDLVYGGPPQGLGRRGTRTRRTARTVSVPIKMLYTLRAGSRRVDCATTIENTARCHRLRLMIPTGRKSDSWFADMAFDVVGRRIALRDTEGWGESDREEKHIKNFAAVCDGRGGLAVVTRGLNEAAVRDDARRTIALTLMRAFREYLYGHTTRESQLVGSRRLEYSLLPFTPDGARPPASLVREMDHFKLPLVSLTHPSNKGVDAALVSELGTPNSIDPQAHPVLRKILDDRPPIPRTLPMSGSLLEVSSPFVLSTVKLSDDALALVVRVWNPLEERAAGAIRANFDFTAVSACDMLEAPYGKLRASGAGRLGVSLGAKRILTVRFELPREGRKL